MSCTTQILTQTIQPCTGNTVQFVSEIAVALPSVNYSVVKADDSITPNRTLVLNPKGTGALTTTRPDSTPIGGNVRGTRAVDLQIDRTIATQVASGNFSVIGGGSENISSGEASTVAGGNINTSSGSVSAIGGGDRNISSGIISTVSGGSENVSSGDGSTISGGQNNNASQSFGTVGGGQGNNASGIVSTISGGTNNNALGSFTTIGGGRTNTILAGTSGFDSTISGGANNRISNVASTIGGGNSNSISGGSSTISGGVQNSVPGTNSTIGGGRQNTASGEGSTVSGGEGNKALGQNSTVGGRSNIASGTLSTIGGGLVNNASGGFSTVPGGTANNASGEGSFACGRNSNAAHNSTFIWGSFLPGDGTTASSAIKQVIFNLATLGNYIPLALPNTFFVNGNHVITGTKSFIIDHPVLSTEENKRTLRHFCAEGPKPDLIYRGLANLIDGKADIDIDLTSKMTSTTFSKLSKDPQVFLTNRSNREWICVEDYDQVSTGKFTILSENSESTAKIDWLVIAERDMGDENVDPEIL